MTFIKMKTASAYSIVWVTAPDLKTARVLSTGALRQKLAACATLAPKIESHYWWKGKVESSAEVFLIFKTIRKRLPALEKFILKNHPYETPEIVACPMQFGNRSYLEWISSSVR